MSNGRGDVVVRVRKIEENIASAAAMDAARTARLAAEEAETALQRTRVHPLAGTSGRLGAAQLMAAAGTSSALRESALSAARRAALAEQTLDDVRRVAMSATARRKAAERLVQRRMEAVQHEEQRREQRLLDEGAAARLT